MGFYFIVIKGKKLIAEENELVFSKSKKIAYEQIDSIDKTFFASKGFFKISYRDESGRRVTEKISDGKYDNLGAVLEHLVSKIS